MESSSISSLPNELLLQVFRETLTLFWPYWDQEDRDHPWYKTPYIRIVTITHVCHRWRVVALHSPDLWTAIDVNQSMECFDSFLERSKPRLLTFRTYPLNLQKPDPADVERLFLKISRYRSLTIGGSDTLFHKQLFIDTYPWDRCAQVIESMEYDSYYFGLPLLFRYELSALKSLTWIDWRERSLMELNCPRLTRLVFRNDELTIFWTEWLEFLRSTPLLQFLELYHAVAPGPPGPLADSMVHLPYLSSLKLRGHPDTEKELFGQGELCLFNHLEFPSNAAIEFDVWHSESCAQVLKAIETRLTHPSLSNRYASTAPDVIAIEYHDHELEITVWDTMPMPLAMCWQWQKTQSNLPLASLRLHCVAPSASILRPYGRVVQFLNKVYPLHMVETLVFNAMPGSKPEAAQVINAFTDISQKAVNVQTLYLGGHNVSTLLKFVLSRTKAPRADDEQLPQDAAQESAHPFSSLKTVSLQQIPTTPYLTQPLTIPTIDQIAKVIHEWEACTDRRINVVHICAKTGSNPPDKPDKCGGSCFKTTDSLHPKLLPLLGSDSHALMDICLRSEKAHESC
ncbi:hypothetical protein EIP86_009647 [Pleurotus ostreatoroseus]|nr:hypothetical protein EIP86_009647 [Pleurotus ostreatoroseus]